jgi:UDP-N-acetylmuramyl pentapeptide synthase
MTLLGLSPEHGAAVIEIGIDEIGAMTQHIALVRPTVSVLTAIGPEHLEKLRDVPTVAAEEAIALFETQAQGGTVVVNLDDPWIAPLLPRLLAARNAAAGQTETQDIIAFSLETASRESSAGENTDSAIPAVTTPGVLTLLGKLSADGLALTVREAGRSETAGFRLPLPGEHNARNLLAAIAVARSLGLSEQEIRAGLAQFRGVDGRSELRLWGEKRVLCDYYNANPSSVEAGLRTLAGLTPSGSGALWACLGDMLELGEGEEALHRGLADAICGLGISRVVLLGEKMRWLADELEKRRKSGAFRGQALHCPSHAAAAEALRAQTAPGDAVLIKGSRGMKMEEVWKRISDSA